MTRSHRTKPRSARTTTDHPTPSAQDDGSSSITPTQYSSHLQTLVLVGLPTLLLFMFGLDFLWVAEDAFITFQSVENLWAGYGPNFNRGVRVESFSHPLWFIILAFLRMFGSAALPTLAAWLGVLMSCAGLALAIQAARARYADRQSLAPFGAVAIAGLPAFWQFASSGLETGLTFFWIGLSTWCLTKLALGPSRWDRWSFLVIGLGPIVRPDLTVISLPLLAAGLFLLQPRARGLSSWCACLLVYIVPGGVWQIFRMGYYAAIVPTTYLAKEGLGSRWDQGLVYCYDLVSTYQLWVVPLIGIVLLTAPRRATEPHSTPPVGVRSVVIPIALCCSAIVHGMLVCRTGGDFMHARLLLPALFALLSACAVVPTSRGHGALLVSFYVWCAAIALWARPSYAPGIAPTGIADERQWYVNRARSARPISLHDYRYHTFYRIGEALTPVIREQGVRAVYWAHIGLAVAMIPDDVIVIDPLALNDHIGARIQLRKRGRPGHEKIVPEVWFRARFPGKQGLVVRNQLNNAFAIKDPPAKVESARLVLSTTPLRELDAAVTHPMSVGLFLTNVRRAWRLTFVSIPPDPDEALQKFVPMMLRLRQK